MSLAARVFSILPQVEEIPFAKELFFVIGCYSTEFLANRTQNYLCKVAKAHWEMRVKLEDSLETQRSVYFKLFAVKFKKQEQQRKALGILFALNFLSDHEQFKKSHFLNMLRHLIPGISILDESFFMFVDGENNRLLCYCEIEKLRGKHLSLREGLYLKKLLAQEIKDTIQVCPPELWAPENEEQTLKDVLRLHKEVTGINDMPHVSISFKDQLSSSVRFLVIIVRVNKKNGPSLKEKVLEFWSDTEIEMERVDEFLHGCVKETLVLSLEMPSALFYRKNYAIDLLKARQYICMTLEQIIGEFRDYNGGLLSKQTEQFNSLADKIPTQGTNLSDFESLFYSLAPSNIQVLISTDMALEISRDFYDLKNDENKKSFDIRFKKSPQIFFIIVKATSSLFDSVFSDIPKTLLTAKTSKKIGQDKYHFLVQMNPSDSLILEKIRTKLVDLEKQRKNLFKKEIRINFQEGSPTSFHPHLNGDVKTFTVCKALYDGLTRIDPKGKIRPSVAKDIKISRCKKKYTFILRDCKWTNGSKVTSYDFARAWQRAIFSRKNGRNPTGSRHLFLIKNAEQIVNEELPLSEIGVHTPDQHTLTVELNYPFPFFLNLLATTIFSPLHGEDLDKEPTIFNGPFVPTLYTPDRIELRKNTYYWDAKKVNLEKITIFFHKDPEKTYNLFKEEVLDWIGSPFNSIPKTKDKEISYYQTNYPFWFFCNTQHPKLKSIYTRYALYLSIDREKLIAEHLPFQKPLYSIVPETLSTINAKDLFPNNPLERASFLFEKGLEEIGYSKEEFTLTINHSDVPSHKKIAQFSKECWENVLGIKVKLIETPWNAYNRDLFSSNFEIGGSDFIMEYENILSFLNLFSNCHNNFSRWTKTEYTNILSQKDRSKKTLKHIEKILIEELPAIPISNQTNPFFMGDLKDFIFPRFGYADFKWAKK